jgi:4-amino-4-deoxy-L-arabinose transferase-like glycosyltransferase
MIFADGIVRLLRPWKEPLLALLILASFFAFLGTGGLIEPDEGRYALLGREMAVTGEWLTPHLNGFEHFQKPPMLYWATALSFELFGENEWAARLPSALAALGVMILSAWLAGMIFGKSSRWMTVLVLAACPGFFILARLLTPDMLMTFFITGAIACLVRAYKNEDGSAFWSWGFFIMMGLGFMTKGPMALVIPVSAAVALQYGARRAGTPFQLPWKAGLAVTTVISLSWFVTMAVIHPELLDYFVGDELVKRFSSGEHGRSKPFWFFVPVLLLSALPWTLLMPGLARDVWRKFRKKTALTPVQWLLTGWLIPPFLILSLSGSKLPTYILPLLPACALLLAAWWRRRSFSPRVLGTGAAAMLMLMVAVASQTGPMNDHFARQASVRSLVEFLDKTPLPPSARIFACNVRAHGFEFYLQRNVSTTRREADIVLTPSPVQEARLFDSPEACEKAMSALDSAYGLVREEDFKAYFPQDKWTVLSRAGDFLLISRRGT